MSNRFSPSQVAWSPQLAVSGNPIKPMGRSRGMSLANVSIKSLDGTRHKIAVAHCLVLPLEFGLKRWFSPGRPIHGKRRAPLVGHGKEMPISRPDPAFFRLQPPHDHAVPLASRSRTSGRGASLGRRGPDHPRDPPRASIPAMAGSSTSTLGDITSDGTAEDIALVFCTRFAAAFGRVMVDPEVPLTTADFELLLTHHRWIDLIFSLSGYRTSDHVVPVLARPRRRTEPDVRRAEFPALSHPAVDEFADPGRTSRTTGRSAASARRSPSSTMSARATCSGRARSNSASRSSSGCPGGSARSSSATLTLARLPEIYMHCSYAVDPRKHAIKADLMRQMRGACLEYGCHEISSERTARCLRAQQL